MGKSNLTRRRIIRNGAVIGTVGALASGVTGASEVSSSSPPEDGGTGGAGVTVQTAGTRNTGDADVLVIRNCLPWDVNANEVVLSDLGASVDVIDSASISGMDLESYGAVIVPSTQDSGYYADLAGARQDIHQYVDRGGVLVAHVTDDGWPCTTRWDRSFVPGIDGHATQYFGAVDLAAPDHPIYEGLSDGELDGWNNSAHGYLTGVTDGAEVLGRVGGEPSHVAYDWGDGHVVATTQTLEWPYASGSGTEALLRQELEYALETSTPRLKLNFPRLAQYAEDTRVLDPQSGDVVYDYRDEFLVDTLFVSREKAVALVDVEAADPDGLDPGDLPAQTTMRVEVTEEIDGRNTTTTHTATVPRDELYDLATGESRMVEFAAAVGMPIFRIDTADTTLQEVMFELAPDSSDLDVNPITIDRGHFEAEERRFRVGFIPVQDPSGGDNYGDDDNGGRPFDYRGTVERAVDFLRDAFPASEVVAYRHDDPMTGAVNDIWDWGGDVGNDARRARNALEAQLPLAVGDTNGPAGIDDFDATLMIAPRADDNNEDYFSYHDKDYSGLELRRSPWAQPITASIALEGGGPGSLSGAAETVAHEIGHHLTNAPYGDAEPQNMDRPMAQRRDGLLGEKIDAQHARTLDHDYDDDGSVDDHPGLVSAGLDLDRGVSSGRLNNFKFREEAPSLLSYNGNRWPDMHLVQRIIEDGYEPRPPESEDVEITDFIVDGTATTDEDGRVQIIEMGWTAGDAMATADGDVTISVVDTDGETIWTHDIPAGMEAIVDHAGSDGNHTDAFTFRVPFPENASRLQFEHAGTVTTTYPVAGILRSAIEALPDRAFVRSPTRRRRALLKKVESVETEIAEDAVTGARNKLANDVRGSIERWVQPYDAGPARFDKAALLSLVDKMIERLGGADGRGSPDR